MAISKKGLRSITVNDQLFYWRFHEKIVIYSKANENSLLIVDFGWYDTWLFVNDKENRPPDFEPRSITPKFVRESILFALNYGWKDGKLLLKYNKGVYTV